MSAATPATDEFGATASSPARLRRRIAPPLLAWFRKHHRDLPWRNDRNPYRIWVSEVMLQQTQVATVIPYFNRFMQRFPTLADLVAADQAEVLRFWEGLGYYRRARVSIAPHNYFKSIDVFPDAPDLLRELPGMGRYTVNAVLSLAFDRRLPILEANSVRVLCRLFGKTEDPTRNPLRKRLWQVAEDLLPARRVGAFNQALMELGALVCTPVSPRCDVCPLRGVCEARRLHLQQSIPFRPVTARQVAVSEVAIVPRRTGRVLLVQRPATAARWANLWEFPHGELLTDETQESAARRLLSELTGLNGIIGRELTTIRHGVTRYAITMECVEATCTRGRFRSAFYQSGKWLLPSALSEYALSGAAAAVGSRT